jgi:murein DD-endopeptidase MepM/ murein hydrolase activator NlpD
MPPRLLAMLLLAVLTGCGADGKSVLAPVVDGLAGSSKRVATTSHPAASKSVSGSVGQDSRAVAVEPFTTTATTDSARPTIEKVESKPLAKPVVLAPLPPTKTQPTKIKGTPAPPLEEHSGADKAGAEKAGDAEQKAVSLAPNVPTENEPQTVAAQPLPKKMAEAKPASTSAPHLYWPLKGRLLSGYGRQDEGRFNDGLNIAAAAGTPIQAAADGKVVYVGNDVPAYGNLVLLEHANGWVTAYGHMEAVYVKRGESVRHGVMIGRVGATGKVAEAQLHFQLRQGKQPVDPAPFLPKMTVSAAG